MKKMNKLMAIGLSLVMCLGMIAPAFATDAYYYVEVDQNGCPDIVTTHPGDSEEGQRLDSGKLTGDGMNGNWAFMGKGEVDDEILEDLGLSIPGSDKRDKVEFGDDGIPEGFELPPEEAQEFNNVQYHQPDQQPGAELGSVTVETFHDIGQYEYDNENSDAAAGQYTYTVTWDNVEAQTGFNLNGSECTEMEYTDNRWSAYYNQNIEYETSDVSCVHVNGTATLHENAKITVIVENNGKDAQNKTEGKDATYVRDTQKENKDVVGKVASGLSEIADDVKNLYDLDVKQSEDGKSVTATYTEQTYTVTYQISGNQTSGVDVSGFGSTNGKATQAWSKDMLEAVLTTRNTGAGSYSFSGWIVTTDADGNVTVTANCTFTPYYYDDTPVGPTEIVVDDQAVPLAAGPVTRAEFIDYLWRHEGEPDSEGVCTFTDVEDTHEYFDALCWAEENGVAEAYFDAEGHEDGTFEPDELVTVGAVREFLDNFANVFGTNAVDAADLTTLTGDDGEAVLNCDQVLAEFFGEEYVLPEDLDTLEPDIAA